MLNHVGRAAVEDFLYEEAALLDDWRLQDWVALFTEDGRYVVPTNDLPDGDPERHLVHIDDDMTRLRARVHRLESRKAHREYPHARTSHQVTNVRVLSADDEHASVAAAFAVWRFRDGRDDHYVGRYSYLLRTVDGSLRIVLKRAVMDMTTLRPAGAVSIIL